MTTVGIRFPTLFHYLDRPTMVSSPTSTGVAHERNNTVGTRLGLMRALGQTPTLRQIIRHMTIYFWRKILAWTQKWFGITTTNTMGLFSAELDFSLVYIFIRFDLHLFCVLVALSLTYQFLIFVVESSYMKHVGASMQISEGCYYYPERHIELTPNSQTDCMYSCQVSIVQSWNKSFFPYKRKRVF